MKYAQIEGMKVSHIALGTKRMPTTDVSRVDHLDVEIAADIVDAALGCGINFFDTSYSNHKGEAEALLGDKLHEHDRDSYFIATGYNDMIDHRYEYVFQKQLKKLQIDHIDFYFVDTLYDMNKDRYETTGCMDFLRSKREEGAIRALGFNSYLTPEALDGVLGEHPYDYVRFKVNAYEWFHNGVRECVEVAKKHGVAVLGHSTLRFGNCQHLKPEAEEILAKAAPGRSLHEWSMGFSKTMQDVASFSINAYSIDQVKDDVTGLDEIQPLSDEEMASLEKAFAPEEA